MWNLYSLLDNPNKPIFHKNLNVFFSTFPYTHAGNTLLINDAPYKSMFNNLYSATFLESFDGLHGEDQCLLGFVLPYLENLDSSRYDVPTFFEHNPFGRIKCIDRNHPRLFKMLFVKCSHTYQPTFCNSVKLKLKQKSTLLIAHLQILFVWISQNFPFNKIYLKYLILLLECCLYFLSLRHLVVAW
jgi:hypothetical protein